jgi:hypothetical protein
MEIGSVEECLGSRHIVRWLMTDDESIKALEGKSRIRMKVISRKLLTDTKENH